MPIGRDAGWRSVGLGGVPGGPSFGRPVIADRRPDSLGNLSNRSVHCGAEFVNCHRFLSISSSSCLSGVSTNRVL